MTGKNATFVRFLGTLSTAQRDAFHEMSLTHRQRIHRLWRSVGAGTAKRAIDTHLDLEYIAISHQLRLLPWG